MSFYSSTNNQTTKKIYSIIDDLEKKLSKRSNSRRQYRVGDNSNFSYYNNLDNTDNINSYYNRPQINSFSNEVYLNPQNTNQSQVIPQNLITNQSSDLDIRRIIKEEFNTLILPYTSDINNNINVLQDKMNNMSKDFQNESDKLRAVKVNNLSDENILKEVKNMLSGYVTFNEYNKKIQELEDLINSNINDLNIKNNYAQKFEDKCNNDIKNISKSIQEMQFANQDYNNKLNNFINNYDNEINILRQNYNKLLTNEIKMNDIVDKNSFLQKNVDGLKEEINNFKNSVNSFLSEKNQKINDLENKQNILGDKINEFENMNKKINKEMDQISNSLKNINETYNKNNISNNNINNDIKDNRDKTDLINSIKIDINKINQINDNYEQLTANNQKIFQILEQHNTTITDLNTKLNVIREDFEKQSKMKYNQINERISKVEDESKDRISYRNSNADNANNLNYQKENEKIKNEINLMKETLEEFGREIQNIQNKNPLDNNNKNESKNNEIEMISNEVQNIKDEIQNINDKIVNIEKELSSKSKEANNDNSNLSEEISNIKNEINNLYSLSKKNNYMMMIANLKNEIDQIKQEIKYYHENENENENEDEQNMNNNIEQNDEIDNEGNQENNIKQNDEIEDEENKENKVIDSNKKYETDKDIDENNNDDLIDLIASNNSKVNPKETFLTIALSKNSVNNENNVQNDLKSNNEENNNVNNSEDKKRSNIDNDSNNDNKPIGQAPVPTGKDPIDFDDDNRFDDFEIEEI